MSRYAKEQKLRARGYLRVVHLEKHTRDLAGKLGLRLGDERVKPLADHILLHLLIGGGKHGRRKGRRGARHSGLLLLGRGRGRSRGSGGLVARLKQEGYL